MAKSQSHQARILKKPVAAEPREEEDRVSSDSEDTADEVERLSRRCGAPWRSTSDLRGQGGRCSRKGFWEKHPTVPDVSVPCSECKPDRLLEHIHKHHTAACQYCPSGTEQVKVVMSLYDNDAVLGMPSSELERLISSGAPQ